MLVIERLIKDYPGNVRALDNVSLNVPDGEFLVLIGLSGSGKSTLLRCINRLIEPTSGRIVLDDVDITATEPGDLRGIRRNIGMIFQQFNLVRRSSVLTNVLTGRLGYVSPWQSVMNHFGEEDFRRQLINREGMTVICSLHFLSLARTYGTRVVALKGGRLMFDGLSSVIDERRFKEIYGEDAVEVEIR